MNESPETAAAGPNTPDANLSFEEALDRLEEIVRRLEEGGLPLEESLSQYQQGVALLKRCYAELSQAEQRVMLLAEGDEGRPVMRPFETAESNEPGVQNFPARSRRAQPPNK